MSKKSAATSAVITSGLYGRRKIYSEYQYIDDANVAAMLTDAIPDYQYNKRHIDYLYDYYRGKQPILYKTKDVRPEINNKVTINRANQIVSFKTGYFIGEPIQYVGRTNEQKLTDNIALLNRFLSEESKATKDKELVEWQEICGTSYRMVMAREPRYKGDAPFELITLDPRQTFVVHSLGIRHEPIAAVYVVNDRVNSVDIEHRYCVYTKSLYIEVLQGKIVKSEPNYLGMIPIIEYPANSARIGAFEPVIPILDTINITESDRLDALDQAINSLLVFYNCELGTDENGNEITPEYVRQAGALFLQKVGETSSDIKELVSNLDQSNTQTLIDDLTKAYTEIVGIPSQGDGNTGDSSNNGAVIFKNGWQGAETRAKDQELSFIPPEQEMLRIIFHICSTTDTPLDLSVGDIQIKFTRRQYDNLQVKAQVLTMLLGCNKVNPVDAYIACSLFADPEEACSRGIEWFNKMLADGLIRDASEQNNQEDVYADNNTV